MRISDWSSDVCSSDLDQLLASLPENAAAEWLSIAYEPVWAIGTGRTPTLDEVAAMHAALRDALRSRIGGEADAMRILYGGSMNGANAASLLAVRTEEHTFELQALMRNSYAVFRLKKKNQQVKTREQQGKSKARRTCDV